MKRVICAIDYDDIPEENKHGSCYVDALHTFMEDPAHRTLVHGIVTGQGPIEGIQYGHAWVEDGDTVIDATLPSSMQCLPKSLYYAIGQIDQTVEYDWHAVQEMLDEYGTYGPWDPLFDNYP